MTLISDILEKIDSLKSVDLAASYAEYCLSMPGLGEPDRNKIRSRVKELKAKVTEEQETSHPRSSLYKQCGCRRIVNGEQNHSCCFFGTNHDRMAIAAESFKGRASNDEQTYLATL